MADIEHATLPDELLHEPKGAATAAAGTVYIADGTGSGSFGKLPTSSLSFNKITVTPGVILPFTNSLVIDTSQLLQGTDNTLEEINTTALPVDVQNTINKNTAQLAAMYNNIVTILAQLKFGVLKNNESILDMLHALEDEGFLG